MIITIPDFDFDDLEPDDKPQPNFFDGNADLNPQDFYADDLEGIEYDPETGEIINEDFDFEDLDLDDDFEIDLDNEDDIEITLSDPYQ